MSYRDDFAAAHARIEALEAELAELREEHGSLLDRLSRRRFYYLAGDAEEQIDSGETKLYGALGVLMEFDPAKCTPGALMLYGHPLEVHNTEKTAR